MWFEIESIDNLDNLNKKYKSLINLDNICKINFSYDPRVLCFIYYPTNNQERNIVLSIYKNKKEAKMAYEVIKNYVLNKQSSKSIDKNNVEKSETFGFVEAIIMAKKIEKEYPIEKIITRKIFDNTNENNKEFEIYLSCYKRPKIARLIFYKNHDKYLRGRAIRFPAYDDIIANDWYLKKIK